jgi:hypothetical protein
MTVSADTESIILRRKYRLYGSALRFVVEIDGVEQGTIGRRSEIIVCVAPGAHRLRMWSDEQFKSTRIVDVAPGAHPIVDLTFSSGRQRRRRQRRLAEADGLDGRVWASIYDLVRAIEFDDRGLILRRTRRFHESKNNRKTTWLYLLVLHAFAGATIGKDRDPTIEDAERFINQVQLRWQVLYPYAATQLRASVMLRLGLTSSPEAVQQGVVPVHLAALLAFLLDQPAEQAMNAMRPEIAEIIRGMRSEASA